MIREPPTMPARHAQRVARMLALLVCALGVCALLGWAADVPLLARLITDSAKMEPNTALALCLAGLGMFLSPAAPWSHRLGRICLGAVALLGAAELVQAWMHIDLGIDGVLFPDRIAGEDTSHPGRMSPVTALNLVLIGLGARWAHHNQPRLSILGQAFVVVTLIMAMHVLFGYAWGPKPFYYLFASTPMAFNTAVALGLSAFACLYSGSDRGLGAVFAAQAPSGTLLRRMLPAVLLTPLLLGWAAVSGGRSGFLGSDVSLAIISTGSTALMVGFLAWIVLSLRSTERQLSIAIEDLAASEKMFRASFENAFVGMAHLDAERKWMRVNRRLADLLGYERDVLLHRTLAELVHAEHLDHLEERLAALQDGRADLYTGQERWIAQNGDVLWFDVHVTTRRSSAGEFRQFIFVLQDVTKAKRTAEQLRVQARSLEAAGTGIVITDARLPDHPIVYVNSAFERLTGYSRDEVLKQNCRFLNRIARDQPELEEVREALKAGRACSVVLKNHTKDGTLFWNELTLSPVLDDRGTVTHFIGIQNDITKRLELAAEAEAFLRTALEERGRAVEASRARDVLLAIVSHELRSPLNSIRLWASLLQTDTRPDDAMIQKAVHQIESSVETQSRLINDLLDVSRIVSGKLELERDRVDLCALARDVTAEFLPAAEKKGVRLETVSPDGQAIVDVDAVRMKQAVRNLIENAIKFTPAGESIEVAVEPCEPEVELRVRDTGAGIAADHLPRIFDQFWQADGQSGRRHGGLGLGLSIVRLVVERHGGRVHAESEGVDRGSTFFIRLPLLERREGAGDSGARTAPLTSTPAGDVLVVDDESDTAEALALALRVRGLRVRVAFDGQAALDAIASERPRVVVSDLTMPGLTGFDLLRTVRNEEHEGSVFRILAMAISGRGSPSDRWRVRRAGFDAFMPKPVRVQAVFRWIEDALAEPPKTEAAERKVLVVGGAAELAQELEHAGHQVHEARDLAAALHAGAKLRPGVLIVDLDTIDGDVEGLVRDLREHRLSLFVIGMASVPPKSLDDEVFDAMLEKPLELDKLRRALKQAQEA